MDGPSPGPTLCRGCGTLPPLQLNSKRKPQPKRTTLRMSSFIFFYFFILVDRCRRRNRGRSRRRFGRVSVRWMPPSPVPPVQRSPVLVMLRGKRIGGGVGQYSAYIGPLRRNARCGEVLGKCAMRALAFCSPTPGMTVITLARSSGSGRVCLPMARATGGLPRSLPFTCVRRSAANLPPRQQHLSNSPF